MIASSPTATNPYRYGRSIREPEWFFGREEQLQTILDRLSKQEATSIVGERRSGKTSLLFQLMNRDVRRKYLSQADDSMYVYVTPELGVCDPSGFFYEVLRALSEQDRTSIQPAEGNASELQMRDCVAHLAPRKLVLLLDEFDAMVKAGSFPSSFFGFLRGLAQSYDVGYITATRENLFECCPEEVLASPFPNIFSPVSMRSFEQTEFDYFIEETCRRSGVSLQKHAESIFALAGRYPFFVQMACSHYFELESRGGDSDPSAHQKVQARFEDDARPHMEAIWNRYLSEKERQVLSALCQRLPGDATVVRRLTQKGYVVEDRVFSSLLARIARERSEGTTEGAYIPQSRQTPAEQGVWVDQDSGDVWVEGERIEPLTRLEYDLLSLLHEYKGKICDKYRIVEEVWSDRYIDVVGDSRIAKLVDRLREKVEPDPAHPQYITTIHGRGYRLETRAQGPAEPD